MPPKKAGGKKGGSKKKKGGADASPENAFQRYLDEMFFISPQARDKQREAHIRKIRHAYESFQHNRDAPVPIDAVGNVIRTMGLNVTVSQERIIKTLVEDPDGSFIVYPELEKMMIGVLATKELTYQITTPEGERKTMTELIYSEPENVILEAFDMIWNETGRQLDPDRVRYIEGEKFREYLASKGPLGEQLDEVLSTKFKETFEDSDTGRIREDVFVMLSLDADVDFNAFTSGAAAQRASIAY